MKFVSKVNLLSALYLFCIDNSHAQFGNLLQQFQKAMPQNQQSGSTLPGSLGAPQQGGLKKGVLMPSDQWCKEQSGALGNLKPNTSLIASEFKIAELDSLQDDFLLALRKTNISKTFPNARFFQSSFETKKVRAIYDTFLAFPEPDTLAALIQISRSNDQQERGDALMALVFLHLQAPNLSISASRWTELYQAALKNEHWTATVFRARLSTYGEFNNPKNIGAALGYLVQAGSLPSKYKQGDGARLEFDNQNFQLIHTLTAKDIFNNEPNMPYRQQWEGPARMGMQIEEAQKAYAARLPEMRVGKMFIAASKLNDESIQIGNEIIKTTQGGNQLQGQIASLQSLKSSSIGEKPVVEDSSPELNAMQLKMISRTKSFEPKQKEMLIAAQEKRLAAQGIVAQSYGEIFQIMMQSMGGDMTRMAAPLPVLAQANNALIQSCMISSKWEQAMRAKDIPKADIKKVESVAGDINSQYKD